MSTGLMYRHADSASLRNPSSYYVGALKLCQSLGWMIIIELFRLVPVLIMITGYRVHVVSNFGLAITDNSTVTWKSPKLYINSLFVFNLCKS